MASVISIKCFKLWCPSWLPSAPRVKQRTSPRRHKRLLQGQPSGRAHVQRERYPGTCPASEERSASARQMVFDQLNEPDSYLVQSTSDIHGNVRNAQRNHTIFQNESRPSFRFQLQRPGDALKHRCDPEGCRQIKVHKHNSGADRRVTVSDADSW